MWEVGGAFHRSDIDTNDLNHDLTTSPWLPPTLCRELRLCKRLDLYIRCVTIIDLLTAFKTIDTYGICKLFSHINHCVILKYYLACSKFHYTIMKTKRFTIHTGQFFFL